MEEGERRRFEKSVFSERHEIYPHKHRYCCYGELPEAAAAAAAAVAARK